MDIKQKLYGALAISAILGLSACGGGGSSSGGGSSPSSVGGSSALGIIKGGVVNAYGFDDDGKVDRSTTLGDSEVTADDGTYSLTLNNGYSRGDAIYIEITADTATPTTMVCDLTVCERDGTGAPTVEFGDSYELDASFTLAAVVPGSSNGSVSANVTALTNLAAAIAVSEAQKGLAPSEAARSANFKVSDRLGLDTSTDLTELPVIDITDADAVNSSDNDALEYNLKAAAALQAALNNANAGSSLEEALSNITNQYATKGMADKESAASGDVTLEELLAEAEAIVTAVENTEGVEEGKTTGTKAKVAQEKSTAQSGSDSPSQGDAPPASEGGEAARQFVQQIRDLGAVSDAQEAFGEELGLGLSSLGRVSGPVMEGMAIAAEAIEHALSTYTEAEGDKPSTVSYEGIDVAISASGDTVTYGIDQMWPPQSEEPGTVQVQQEFPTVQIVLTAVDDGSEVVSESETETDSRYDFEFDATFDFAIEGSVASDDAKLTIHEGSQLAMDIFESETDEYEYSETNSQDGFESTYSEDFESLLEVDDARFVLNVTLEELEEEQSSEGGDVQASATEESVQEPSGPTSFTGLFDLNIDLIRAEESGTYSDTESYPSEGEWEFSEEEELTMTNRMEGAELTMSGAFAVGDREVSGSLAVIMDNISESCNGGYESGYNAQQGWYWNDTLECDEAFQGTVSISMGFALDLDGMASDVDFSATAVAEGTSNPTLDIDLEYGEGESLSLDFTYAPDERNLPTISSHNGVELILSYVNDESDDIEGELTQGGERVGVVNERRGFLAVTYPNGEFESLQ